MSIDWPQPTFPYLVGDTKCKGHQHLFFKPNTCFVNTSINVFNEHTDGGDNFTMMKIEHIPNFESSGKLKLTIFLAKQGITGSYDGYRNNYEPKSAEYVIAMQVCFFDRVINYIQGAYGIQNEQRKDVEKLRSNFDQDVHLKKIKEGVYRCLDVENWNNTPKYLKVLAILNKDKPCATVNCMPQTVVLEENSSYDPNYGVTAVILAENKENIPICVEMFMPSGSQISVQAMHLNDCIAHDISLDNLREATLIAKGQKAVDELNTQIESMPLPQRAVTCHRVSQSLMSRLSTI